MDRSSRAGRTASICRLGWIAQGRNPLLLSPARLPVAQLDAVVAPGNEDQKTMDTFIFLLDELARVDPLRRSEPVRPCLTDQPTPPLPKSPTDPTSAISATSVTSSSFATTVPSAASVVSRNSDTSSSTATTCVNSAILPDATSFPPAPSRVTCRS